jgi:hypothetical protein
MEIDSAARACTLPGHLKPREVDIPDPEPSSGSGEVQLSLPEGAIRALSAMEEAGVGAITVVSRDGRWAAFYVSGEPDFVAAVSRAVDSVARKTELPSPG